jgi:hypothetical protein
LPGTDDDLHDLADDAGDLFRRGARRDRRLLCFLGMAASGKGMPAGSPGMEAAGREPYTTVLILNDGSTRVFGRHNGA